MWIMSTETVSLQPERIQGQEYTIKADVWSLGVSLHEVAHLRYPFAPEGETRYLAPIELVTHIVNTEIPEMRNDTSVGRTWSEPIKDFHAALVGLRVPSIA